jgi:small-conductance mechanosensitive channel
MPVAQDIAATYRGPRRVVARLLAMGPREDRALALLMGGCALMFVAQWPRLAREAHLAHEALNPRLAGALLGWIVIAPLMFYLLAFISQLIARLIGGRVTGYGARIALFWAFLAAAPVLLLHGLVAGFIGPGAGMTIIGAIWCGVFLWFWLSGLREAGWSRR